MLIEPYTLNLGLRFRLGRDMAADASFQGLLPAVVLVSLVAASGI